MQPRSMRLVRRSGIAPVIEPPPLSVLTFTSRSAAVAYCLRVSDALRDARSGGVEDDAPPSALWLAASEDHGAFRVFACDRSLAAARGAMIEWPVSGRIRHAELPAARCLIVGEALS